MRDFFGGGVHVPDHRDVEATFVNALLNVFRTRLNGVPVWHDDQGPFPRTKKGYICFNRRLRWRACAGGNARFLRFVNPAYTGVHKERHRTHGSFVLVELYARHSGLKAIRGVHVHGKSWNHFWKVPLVLVHGFGDDGALPVTLPPSSTKGFFATRRFARRDVPPQSWYDDISGPRPVHGVQKQTRLILLHRRRHWSPSAPTRPNRRNLR